MLPMVNLVFRNMAAGMGNNRNGNASLSFVFRNVRNIVQSLQQNNNTSSTAATNVTTSTTTVTAQSSTTTTTVTASSASASQGSSASSGESVPVSISSPDTAASPQPASTSAAAGPGVDAASDNAANTSLPSTSRKENNRGVSHEFSSQPTSGISFEAHSSSSGSASSSATLHNQRHSDSTASPSQGCSQGSADYMAVPVGIAKHNLHSTEQERVQGSKLSESSDKSLNNHRSENQSSESVSQPCDKSPSEPHSTRSCVQQSTSYDVLRPPEQTPRQTSPAHHLDNNGSN